MRRILLITTTLLLVAQQGFAGKEIEIATDEVPVAIYQEAINLLEDFEMERAQIEDEEDGTRVYELIGYHDTIMTEIDVLEDGTIQEYEKNLPEKYVPYAVRKAVQMNYPGFKFMRFEASHNSQHKIVKYEIVGRYQGVILDLEVSPGGRRIEESDS